MAGEDMEIPVIDLEIPVIDLEIPVIDLNNYHKIYYQNNKKKLNEQRRLNYQKNREKNRIRCDLCNIDYVKKSDLPKHFKTKKHQNNLILQQNPTLAPPIPSTNGTAILDGVEGE